MCYSSLRHSCVSFKIIDLFFCWASHFFLGRRRAILFLPDKQLSDHKQCKECALFYKVCDYLLVLSCLCAKSCLCSSCSQEDRSQMSHYFHGFCLLFSYLSQIIRLTVYPSVSERKWIRVGNSIKYSFPIHCPTLCRLPRNVCTTRETHHGSVSTQVRVEATLIEWKQILSVCSCSSLG